jgi:hypothetical protein
MDERGIFFKPLAKKEKGMAHELSVQNEKAEMFYYGDRPWHGLGTAVDRAPTASEAIVAAGLDWLLFSSCRTFPIHIPKRP